MNEACSNKLITVHQLLADWSITIPLDRYAKCTVSATYARWFRVTSSWVCVFLYVCVRLSLSLCVSQSTHIFSHQLVHWKVDCSAVLLLFLQKEDADLMGARHFLRPEYSVSWKETLKPSGQPSGGSAVTGSNCCLRCESPMGIMASVSAHYLFEESPRWWCNFVLQSGDWRA